MMIIGIAGGSGSGKTTVVKAVTKALGKDVAVISQDSYYKDRSEISLEERKKINFDHPDSIDWDLLCEHLEALKGGHSVQQPIYSYVTCIRDPQNTIEIKPAEVIIVEGILVLAIARLRKLMDIKIFVDTEADDRLMRIVYRDILERGRDMDTAFKHYQDTVKPMHLQFIEPSKRYADVIIPEGGNNVVAINMIVSAIRKHVK